MKPNPVSLTGSSMVVGSRSMMVPYMTGRLLLMTLLVQTTENQEWMEQTTHKPDTSEHYQEFCLHVPKAPTWTSSKSPAQMPVPTPTRTANPKAPLIVANLKSGVRSAPEPVPRVRAPAPSGCRCQKGSRKKLSGRGMVRRQIIRQIVQFPTITCGFTEYFKYLEDGRQVCVDPFRLASYFLHSLFNPTTKPRTTKPPLVSTTLPQTRNDLIANADASLEADETTDVKGLGSSLNGELIKHPRILEIDPGTFIIVPQTIQIPNFVFGPPGVLGPPCHRCSPVDWNSIKPNHVQALEMNLTPSNCPTIIQVKLTDGKEFCMDSSQPDFMEHLNMLESQ
nr:uncharacterized protein LOC107376761 [Nothobranchius furzeri]